MVIGNDDGSEFTAPVESVFTDGGDGVRDVDGSQAPTKCTFTDVGDGVGNTGAPTTNN